MAELEKRWRVLVADPGSAGAIPDVAPQFENLDLVGADESNAASALAGPGIEALITGTDPVDATLLGDLPDLRVVLKMGRSYHNVDAQAVRARGLTFASSPRKGPNCVAELAITLILALSKDLGMSHQSVAEGAYQFRGLRPEKSAQWKMAFHWMQNTAVHEVRGKTLGIVGMGEIGCELALRASAMGMRNLYHKRTPLSPELEGRFQASYRDLDALLAESDYVCLAVPHTDETERMIGEAELAKMRTGSFLVNICRGGVVDEDALIHALETQHLAGAGLDVFVYEPLPADSPLCQLHNVIMTPHIGGGSGTNRVIELTDALAELTHIQNNNPPHVDLS